MDVLSSYPRPYNVRRETDFLDYGSTKPNIEVIGQLYETKIHLSQSIHLNDIFVVNTKDLDC